MSCIADIRAASSRRGPASLLRWELRATPSTLRVSPVAAAASSSTSASPDGSVLRTVAGGDVDPAVSGSVTVVVIIADADRIVDHAVPVRDGDDDYGGGSGDGDRRRAECGDDVRTVAVRVRLRGSFGYRFAAGRARDSVSAGTSIRTADTSDERTCRCGARELRHLRPRFRGPCRSIARFHEASMPHEDPFRKSSCATGAPKPPAIPRIAYDDDHLRCSGSSLLPLENTPAQSPLGLNPLFPLGNRPEYGFLLSISSPTAPRRFLSHTRRIVDAWRAMTGHACHCPRHSDISHTPAQACRAGRTCPVCRHRQCLDFAGFYEP